MTQYVSIDKLITELVRVERNVAAIALAKGVTLPEVMAFANGSALPDDDNNNNNNNRVAPMPLPEGLKHRVRDKRALERALERGYVVPLSNHWAWTAGSKRLLAYFMGRLLCGDYTKSSGGTAVWKQGRGTFPDRELTRLFSMGSLRSLRKNGFFSPLPQGHEMIDSLFDNE